VTSKTVIRRLTQAPKGHHSHLGYLGNECGVGNYQAGWGLSRGGARRQGGTWSPVPPLGSQRGPAKFRVDTGLNGVYKRLSQPEALNERRENGLGRVGG
jgi:hypothetical protein